MNMNQRRERREKYFLCDYCVGFFLLVALNTTSGVTSLIQNMILSHSSVQSLSRVQLFATPWIAACQASLPITNSQSLFRVMSIESVMPSSHLILSRPLLLLPSMPPSIRVFSSESTLHMRCQSIGLSALASVLPMNTQDWSLNGLVWISL